MLFIPRCGVFRCGSLRCGSEPLVLRSSGPWLLGLLIFWFLFAALGRLRKQEITAFGVFERLGIPQIVFVVLELLGTLSSTTFGVF